MMRNRYLKMYGTIIKFPASGGGVYWPFVKAGKRGKKTIVYPFRDEPTHWGYTPAGTLPMWVKGHSWVYEGVSPLPHPTGGGDASCSCVTCRFAVDDYGRVYAPDAFRFAVQVLDTNGNPLLRFGEYGNTDSAGKGSLVPKPDIPLYFPRGIDVCRNAVYITDMFNHRILKIRLSYREEAGSKVKVE